MYRFIEMINALDDTNKAEEKAAAIRKLDDEGKKLVQLALSPYVVFGVKRIPMPDHYVKKDNGAKAFYDLCDALARRSVTGQAALDSIELVLSGYTKPTAEVLARVLQKNLRAGATAKTFNKVWPGLVPTFDMMLAATVDSLAEVKYPKLAEVKYDGMRNIAVVRGRTVQHFSRKGIEQPQFSVLDRDLVQLRDDAGVDVVFDGEVLSGTSFQDTMQRGNADPTTLRFHVFDYMPLADWEARGAGGRGMLPQDRRREALLQLLVKSKPYCVALSRGHVVQNVVEAEQLFNEAKQAGFEEGLMFKDLAARYVWGRSKAWEKWKPTKTVDLKVIGWAYGETGGKHEKTVGALECTGEDENGRKIGSMVGGGLSDDLRAMLLRMAKKGTLLNVVVEVEFDKLTKAKGKDVWSLRFPRVKRVRFDK